MWKGKDWIQRTKNKGQKTKNITAIFMLLFILFCIEVDEINA